MLKWLVDLPRITEGIEMGREERQKLIAEIEAMRGSKVITYFISTKPKIQTQIDPLDPRTIYDHLLKIGQTDKIDLFLYSLGGATPVAWALSNLIREFTKDFTVLIPSFAFSCATSIALGANKIIMGKMGTLGPVDPQVSNDFNPKINGQTAPISVEDIAGYISLIKDKMELKEEANLSDLFSKLCQSVHPLALGNAFRQYIKARDDARKLLELHMDSKANEVLIKSIVDTLVEKLYFHGHHIPRTEAKSIGLDVQNAEEITCDGKTLDTIMWELFLDYEKDLSMKQPYCDRLSAIGEKRFIPVKMVESIGLTSALVIEQQYTKIEAPKGSYFTKVDNLFALAHPQPNGPIQVVPYDFLGDAPANINNELYRKQEISYWKTYSKDLEVRTPDKS